MKKIKYFNNTQRSQKGISIIALIISILVLVIITGAGVGYFTGIYLKEDYTDNNNSNKNENSIVESGSEENKTPSVAEHIHNYKTVVRSEEATCNQPAKTILKCDCGNETTVSDKVALGHIWNKKEQTKKATCQEEGEITYTCTRCGATMTDSTEKILHNFTNKTAEDKYLASKATDTKPATYYYKCQTCDEHGEETYIKY